MAQLEHVMFWLGAAGALAGVFVGLLIVRCAQVLVLALAGVIARRDRIYVARIRARALARANAATDSDLRLMLSQAVGGIGGAAPDVHLSPRRVPGAMGQGAETAPLSPCP